VKSASFLALLTVVGLAACAASPPKSANGVAKPVAVDTASDAAEQQRLRDIIVSTAKQTGRDVAELREVIAAPAFNSLAVEDQFQALTLAAGAAMATDAALAHSYLGRAIALPGIEFEDQLTALGLAVKSKCAAAADKSLALLARQWPERLASVDQRLILRGLSLTQHVSRADMFLALQALYAAHWKIKADIEPSAYWRNLVLLLLEQGSIPQAIDVSTHITEPYVLIAMRADRRFDTVVAAHPEQFAVEAAAERELKHFQSLSDAQPKSLELITHTMDVLRSQQHYEAMLAVSDSVVQAIETTNFPERLYDDYVENHGKLFQLRSIALQRVGSWDEAVAQLVEAAHDGNINVIVSLADLYCALDRPRDALAAISPLGPTRTSAYGAMQVEAIKLQAAVELGDQDQVTRSLAFLSAHRTDSPDAYMFSLVVAKQFDLAAQYLIAELQDPDLRQSALLNVQIYLPSPGTETELKFEAQWRTLIARKDVQAAIHKVGRIESYQLEEP
jgi:hypothetical protein